MRKSDLVINVTLLTSFLLIFVQCSNDERDILAEIDNYTIHSDDFRSRYQKFLTSTGVTDRLSARRQMMNGMIGETLLLKFDDNQSVFNNPEYQLMQERINKELLLGYYRTEEVDKKISIDDNDLRNEFVRINERLSARHLFTRDKEEANQLYQKLLDGYTFEQLAPLVFDDDSLAQNGGFLGYFTWGDMDPAFEEAAYSLKPGEISRPVQTDYGYSIIKVESRVRHPLLTEDQFLRKKNNLRRMVYIRKKKQVEKQIINDIIKDLDIKTDDQGLEILAGRLGLGSVANLDDGETMSNHRMVISYGNYSLSVMEAQNAINKLAPSNKRRIRSSENLETALRGLAVQDWLLRDAKSKGYDQASPFLEQQKLWESEKFLQFKRRTIFEEISISDSVALAYFQMNRNDFIREERVNVQEILVASKAEALQIVESLRNGADFSKMARKHSLRSFSADTDGILGLSPLSRYGNLKGLFESAAIDKIIGPEKVDDFYLIARIIERENSRLFEYPEVKEAIIATLKANMERENFAAYVDSLRSAHVVTVNDQLLMSLKLEVN